jgi:two-component system chemotaxis response regulator CheY
VLVPALPVLPTSSLPQVRERLVEDEDGVRAAQHHVRTRPALPWRGVLVKVLVVDDDPVGLMLATELVDALGHEVLTARDGFAAWAVLQREHVDVLVTDREMPGLDGLRLCERVRLRGAARPGGAVAGDRGYCYVIILTGHDSAEQAYAGMAAGADDYLVKPLQDHQLRLRLVSAQRVTDLHRQLARQHVELNAVGEAQHALARRDPLTLLPNRLALQEHLDRLDADQRRYGRGFSVAVLDVDHFKSVNDAGGHAAGDDVLRRLAAGLQAEVRETDGLYRYGGEEFVHVLQTPSPAAARVAVERLRAAAHRLALPHGGRPGELVTLSAGVATCEDGAGVAGAVLLEQADAALYTAKSSGRDRLRQHVRTRPPVGVLPALVGGDAGAHGAPAEGRAGLR